MTLLPFLEPGFPKYIYDLFENAILFDKYKIK